MFVEMYEAFLKQMELDVRNWISAEVVPRLESSYVGSSMLQVKVYTWGCNDDGALGRVATGSDNGEEYLPRKVAQPEGVKVVKVSAGDSHTSALTTDGEVYAWGSYPDGSNTSTGVRLGTQQLRTAGRWVKVFGFFEDADGFKSLFVVGIA